MRKHAKFSLETLVKTKKELGRIDYSKIEFNKFSDFSFISG